MVARYQSLGHVCTTASSDLYHGRCLEDGSAVLLKTPKDLLPVRLSRFQKECTALQSLDIPGLVKPLALVSDEGRSMMVLDDFAGEPLESVLHLIDIPACLRLGSELARILGGLHAARIIHRDIRPANILLDIPGGQLRLLDLSLAAIDTQKVALPGDEPPGDWAYASPEQTGRMNRPLDYRTDFYSLGITLYRLLTGRLPFAADDPLEWTHCHIARIPAPPRELAPQVPHVLSDIVMRLLAKLPEDRYQSAYGIKADLDRCLQQWEVAERIEPFPIGTDDGSDSFRIPPKLYGRDREVATLLDAFGRMAATGEAVLLTVAGYSGIGKSSLVHELQRPIVRERGYFIAGKFDQYLRDIPYATLAQAFRELMQQLLAESEARIDAWRRQIQDAVGINGQLIVDVLPQVELIIGKQPPVQALPPAETQHRFRMVFRQFLEVFTHKEHPLVLFLDDLQWIDRASLALIEYLFTYPDMRYLLLIGAYRDNEVDVAHPLTRSLDVIRRSGAAMTEIRLAPPAPEALNRLVADTLHVSAEACRPLTQLVFDRTGGNPFFFTQFLASLHQDGLLQHDARKRIWKWDLARIKAKDFADNVVDLMVDKLRRLPVPAQDILQLAACLGNKFTLRSLALVSPVAEVERCLAPAIDEGLIVCTEGSGKFLHDRIQQAAYSLIPETRRDAMHLRIGMILMENLPPDDLAEQLFDVANQLNHGSMLFCGQDEKARVAELNLRAGRKAKTSTAYASACIYLAAGTALLGTDCWSSRYELTFQLWLERANCEFLNANFTIAEHLIADLLPRCASKTDKAAAYRLQVEICEIKSENRRAVDKALECLRLFGIEMPAHPSRAQVEAEYEKFLSNLGTRRIESLVDLPLTDDPEILAMMHMLSALFTPALFTDLNLVHLHLVQMANLTLKHGTTGASTHGYAWLGLFLGPVFHRYQDGYRFAKLAVDLVEKHGFIAYKAKLYLAMGLVAFWTQPIQATIDFMRIAFDSGVASGDLTFACYNCNNILTVRLMGGDHLDEVWEESEKSLAFDRKVKFHDVADIIISQQRFIQNMRGRTMHFSTFSDGQFDESAFEAQLTPDRMATMICWYWILKVQARFISGDYEIALGAAAKAKELLWSSDAFIQLLDYHYYTALSLAALCDAAPPARRGSLLAQLATHREQLREWSENCSATFFDKHALVAAETARLEGRDLDAMHLYEQAIRSARENDFFHSQGVACELASAFYRARGFQTFADAYLREACCCFDRWGAEGKVRHLKERYPQLGTQQETSSGVPTGGVELDVLSVAKASQAISGRIVLDELIDTLMRIMLENAGAQSSYLVLCRGGDLRLAAQAGVGGQTIQVQLYDKQTLPESHLPGSILNYVRRSRERVLLADAAQPHPFSADDYFSHRQPKSVLCQPILRQAELVGMLYLENNLVTHAFTAERLAVLELLAAQAAISLENALLYTDLQQENSERKRAETNLREREARIRRLVESNIIGILFWDTKGGINEANDAFLRMVGYGREELLASRIQWHGLTPPEYHALDAQKVMEVRTTGTCVPFEKEYLRKDGSRVPVLVGAALFEGSQEQGVAFVLDLTEHKQSEAERQARQVAEAANQAKTRFLANMSHELRSPLNTILGFARIMARQTSLPHAAREDLGIILRSGELLHTLINQVLDLSKIEAGRATLNETSIDLDRMLLELKDMFAFRAADRGLQLEFDIAPGLPRFIMADHVKLRQVLINLLSNALKFTRHGNVTLRVAPCPLSSVGTRLSFAVADTGPGIAAHELDSVFDAFIQAGAGRHTQEGTGLGLTISRSFVQLMGGELHIDSEVGAGTTVSFDVPVQIIDTQASSPAERLRRVVGLAPGQPRYRVLAADDRKEARQLLVRLLTPLGFEVREACNGQEAVEIWRKWHPQLVWMDIRMPVLDGYEATRRIRAEGKARETIIIALTASSFEEERADILSAGCDDLLRKPFLENDMFALMQKHLDVRFVYEEEPGRVQPPPAEMNEALSRLPSPLQDTLERALVELDTDGLRAAITEVRTCDAALADTLQGLVNEFQFDQILHCLELGHAASAGGE
jgi:PAS domain S-box-containing protein